MEKIGFISICFFLTLIPSLLFAENFHCVDEIRTGLVKEEKSLLMALESGEEKTIINTLKSVLKSCLLTRGIKIEDLPSFDLEFLFLNIRGKSVGESVELMITCQDDGVTQVPLSLQMSDIKLVIPDDHSDTIDLGDDLRIKLKYPSFTQFAENNFLASKVKENELINKAFELQAQGAVHRMTVT